MLIPVSTHSQLTKLGSMPILAVDMGFSGKSASCGYAFRAVGDQHSTSKNMMFAQCSNAVVEQIKKLGNLLLIIEAPLSAAFDSKGNPQSRGSFESTPKPRWWSLGPGASMSLAAMYFLKRLAAHIPTSHQCHLVEGYVVGADSGNDADVAVALIQAVCSEHKCAWQAPHGHQLVSVLDWVQPGTAGAASPIILIPEFQ